MGYKPSIDSYEEVVGGWTDRREVLAWSAGTQIAVRIKETSQKGAKTLTESSENQDLDEYKHLRSWYSYQIPQGREGQDDITALKLLRPHQVANSDCIVVGTASGQLKALRVDIDAQKLRVHSYGSQQRPVGAISVSPDERPLMSATLGDDTLALYSLDAREDLNNDEDPLSQVQPLALGAQTGRVWSCDFISKDKVVRNSAVRSASREQFRRATA
jgi:WD40 repeat protein